MSDKELLPHNLGLDLVRATEAAALAAGRWLGLGQPDEADLAASRAMAGALHDVEMDGRLCLGDEARQGGETAFMTGQRFGTGLGPEVDVLADAIDGKRLLAGGYPGAISAVAVAPRGGLPQWKASTEGPSRGTFRGPLTAEVPKADLKGLREFDVHVFLESRSGVDQPARSAASVSRLEIQAR